MGFPRTCLSRCFGHRSPSRPGGLGIGLYQCKQIVEANRGTIQVRSGEGKGTQVRIELPLPRASESRQDKVMAKSTLP